MPFREMLEDYPLYRKHNVQLPQLLAQLTLPAVTMYCENEKSMQTFNSARKLHELQLQGDNAPCWYQVLHLEYQCASCISFRRHFLIQVADSGQFVVKVGQCPPWDIRPDPALEAALDDKGDFYKRGLICESQGYGIGAFAYYRRVLEEIIDRLLQDIEGLLLGEERDRYSAALLKAKETRVTSDKIALVKDLLPPILRPDGINPLSVLHETLSEGLHDKTDEDCMGLAATAREALVFLVNQVSATKNAGSKFTESMRRLLDRRHSGAA